MKIDLNDIYTVLNHTIKYFVGCRSVVICELIAFESVILDKDIVDKVVNPNDSDNELDVLIAFNIREAIIFEQGKKLLYNNYDDNTKKLLDENYENYIKKIVVSIRAKMYPKHYKIDKKVFSMAVSNTKSLFALNAANTTSINVSEWIIERSVSKLIRQTTLNIKKKMRNYLYSYSNFAYDKIEEKISIYINNLLCGNNFSEEKSNRIRKVYKKINILFISSIQVILNPDSIYISQSENIKCQSVRDICNIVINKNNVTDNPSDSIMPLRKLYKIPEHLHEHFIIPNNLVTSNLKSNLAKVEEILVTRLIKKTTPRLKMTDISNVPKLFRAFEEHYLTYHENKDKFRILYLEFCYYLTKLLIQHEIQENNIDSSDYYNQIEKHIIFMFFPSKIQRECIKIQYEEEIADNVYLPEELVYKK